MTKARSGKLLTLAPTKRLTAHSVYRKAQHGRIDLCKGIRPINASDEAARSFTRRANGNELKILLAVRYLEDTGQATTADAISDEAMINRSTVYRLLPRIAAKNWIQYRLTDQGRLITQYALTELSRPITAYITDTPGPSPNRLPGNDTSPTGVANCDAAAPVKPSHFATESQSKTPPTLQPDPNVKNRTKTDSTFGSAHQRAKEWAQWSHRAVEPDQDQNPPKHLGNHIARWRLALYLDETKPMNPPRAHQLQQIVTQLIERRQRGEGPQGRAWTATTKRLLDTWNNQS